MTSDIRIPGRDTLRRRLATLIVAVVASTQMLGMSPATANDFNIGEGPLNGVKSAAQTTLKNNASCGLSKNQLTALMVSIPMWELLGGSRTLSPSPMTLSRWDIWNQTSNHPLFSDGTYDGFPRAHWNPGVGLWQLDTWSRTIDLNQWRRIQPQQGGKEVADYLRSGWCTGTSTVRSRLNNTWYGCQNDKCWNSYKEIYNASSDTLNLDVNQSLTSWSGGLSVHSCRNGSAGTAFNCGYVNVNDIEGYADLTYLAGQSKSARTPVAQPFMSYNRGGKKWAVWLQSGTGWSKDYSRWAATDTNARYSGSWSHSSDLEVHRCSGTYCYWSPFGLDP